MIVPVRLCILLVPAALAAPALSFPQDAAEQKALALIKRRAQSEKNVAAPQATIPPKSPPGKAEEDRDETLSDSDDEQLFSCEYTQTAPFSTCQ